MDDWGYHHDYGNPQIRVKLSFTPIRTISDQWFNSWCRYVICGSFQRLSRWFFVWRCDVFPLTNCHHGIWWFLHGVFMGGMMPLVMTGVKNHLGDMLDMTWTKPQWLQGISTDQFLTGRDSWLFFTAQLRYLMVMPLMRMSHHLPNNFWAHQRVMNSYIDHQQPLISLIKSSYYLACNLGSNCLCFSIHQFKGAEHPFNFQLPWGEQKRAGCRVLTHSQVMPREN